jgi:phosphomannomutase
LRGDLLGLIAARFLNAKTVATPVTSNSGLEDDGGFSVIRTRVGSPYVIAAMEAALADGKEGVIGFEANGGLMLGSDFTLEGKVLKALPTRDSFLPALAALGMAAQTGQSLSGLVKVFSLPVALSDRLENFATERSASLMAHIRQSPENLSSFLSPIGSVAEVSDIDGVRATLADGRVIHFRPSGNAPEMRCYVEAKSHADAEALLKSGLDLLRSWGG